MPAPNIDPVSSTVLGAFSIAVLAFTKSLFRTSKKSNDLLVQRIEERNADVLLARSERDEARRLAEKNYEKYLKERKERVAVEYALELNNMDIGRFLASKGIDPLEFKPVTAEKAKRVQVKRPEQLEAGGEN